MNGDIVLEICPADGNPRNSEGAFLDTRRGLLFVYTAFSGQAARDHTAADIAAILSPDRGKRFSSPRTLFRTKDFQAMNVMSVSLLRMQSGAIGLFFLVRKSFQDMRPYLAVSVDEGLTFGEARPIAQRVSYYVMNNDRAIRLPTGRILLPLAEHRALNADASLPDFHPGTLTYLYSDDDGQTFQETRTPLSLNCPHSITGLQEPGCLSLGDDLVYSWARTDRGFQYEMLSRDGGRTWSAPRPSVFSSPLSPLSMKRLPGGSLFAVWNPIPSYQTRKVDSRTGGRSPLVYAISRDEGLHWTEPVIIEDDPHSGYCYCAIHAGKEGLLLAYCAGKADRDGSCLNRLRMRSIPYERLREPLKMPSPEGAMGIGLAKEEHALPSGES